MGKKNRKKNKTTLKNEQPNRSEQTRNGKTDSRNSLESDNKTQTHGYGVADVDKTSRNGQTDFHTSLEDVGKILQNGQTERHNSRENVDKETSKRQNDNQNSLEHVNQTSMQSITKHTDAVSKTHVKETHSSIDGQTPPGPPIVPWIKEYNTSPSMNITLEWEPPFMTVNEPLIEGYIVEMKRGHQWEMVYSGDMTSISVYIGKSDSEMYHFRIFACNKVDRGKSLEYAFKPVVPNRPYSLYAKESTSSVVNLRWMPPVNGVTPNGYLIEKQKMNSFLWEKVDRVETPDTFTYDVHDLRQNTCYTFRVTAFNNAGSSLPTECYTYSKITKQESTIPRSNKSVQKSKSKKTRTIRRCDGECSSKKKELVMELRCTFSHSFCINCSRGICDKPWTDYNGYETVNFFVCPKCMECTREKDLKFLSDNTSFLPGVSLLLGYQGNNDGCTYDLCNYETTDIRGLPNVGMTCYANSIFQVLAQTPNLTNHLLDIMITNDLDSKSSFTGLLRNVLMHIQKDITADVKQIYTSLQCLVNKVCDSDRSFQMGEQNDSHSFLIALFNGIKNEVKDEKKEEILTMFRGYIASEFSYTPCGDYEYSDEQEFINLLLPVENNSGMITVLKGLETLAQREEFPENILPCRTCQSPSNTVTTKVTTITEPPEILILQLGKFRQEEGRVAKYDVSVSYDEVLALDPYISKTYKKWQCV